MEEVEPFRIYSFLPFAIRCVNSKLKTFKDKQGASGTCAKTLRSIGCRKHRVPRSALRVNVNLIVRALSRDQKDREVSNVVVVVLAFGK
jgi:hypothetical protein